MRVDDAVGLADGMRAGRTEHLLESRNEGAEHIEYLSGRTVQRSADLRIDDGAEYQRCQAVGGRSPVNQVDGLARLGHGIDERQSNAAEIMALELGQQALAEGFGGNGGAIGDEQDGSAHGQALKYEELADT